jgi:hypothetical protein
MKAGDLIELHGHVVCNVDVELPIGTKCEIVFVYPGGNVFEVRIPGVRETQIIPEPCLRWLANEAAERSERL